VVQDKQHPGNYHLSHVPAADMMFTHVKPMHAGQVVIVELDSHLHSDKRIAVWLLRLLKRLLVGLVARPRGICGRP
jgi:hypothetical protein